MDGFGDKSMVLWSERKHKNGLNKEENMYLHGSTN